LADPHVTLLFPPATDPRNPHLALPSLAAALRAAGVRVTMRDLDLEGLLWLLEPARLAEGVGRALRSAPPPAGGGPMALRLRGLMADAEQVVAEAARAPSVLRDAEAFFDPHAYRLAREAMSGALDLVSRGFGGMRYNVAPVSYEVAGVDPSRIADLLKVTADPGADLFRDFYAERLLPDLEADRPDAIGISILNHQQALPGLMLARRLKEAGHFVVLGGTVYTKFVDRLRELPEFFTAFCDGLIAYEGETAMCVLVDELSSGTPDLARVPNLLSLDPHGAPQLGPHHLEDVNSLPTPDFEGLPLGDYLAPAPVLPILMGKGCYFNKCKFCDIPFINRTSRKSYRIRTPERVAQDVAELTWRHGAHHFEITDEALAPRLLLHLGEALESHPGLEPRFTGFARFEPAFTAEACEQLYGMGMRKFFFGLESGSQVTLDHMKKGIRVDVAERVLANCRAAGIAFHIFSMIGFPEETPELARETEDFFVRNRELIEAPHNSFDIHRFSLDLRTEYGEYPERFGLRVDLEAEEARDFPLSADGWQADRGMDNETIVALLERFTATLHDTYRGSHAYPFHLWPDWATYSVLYSDHYASRPFQHRLGLPQPGDPLRFRLPWSEGVRVEPDAGGYRVSCPTGEGVAPEPVLLALARPREHMSVDELLAAVARDAGEEPGSRGAMHDELRALIDGLLVVGALRFEAAEGERPTPRPRQEMTAA
jgi:anaerobic magnesium-protoporphyrin IX monomethyl ester cyclase